MLRRPPTLITLTSDDIAAYEANRQRRQWEQSQNSQLSSISSKNASSGKDKDPNDELRPLPQEKARIARTREERIMGSRN
jgi:Anaphase-promoting complex APC subunit CDC26